MCHFCHRECNPGLKSGGGFIVSEIYSVSAQPLFLSYTQYRNRIFYEYGLPYKVDLLPLTTGLTTGMLCLHLRSPTGMALCDVVSHAQLLVHHAEIYFCPLDTSEILRDVVTQIMISFPSIRSYVGSFLIGHQNGAGRFSADNNPSSHCAPLLTGQGSCPTPWGWFS